MKEKVILCFHRNYDYLFEIENIEILKTAIEYKNEQRETKEYEGWSDIEIIIDFLNKNNIEYNYTDLFSLEKLEY